MKKVSFTIAVFIASGFFCLQSSSVNAQNRSVNKPTEIVDSFINHTASQVKSKTASANNSMWLPQKKEHYVVDDFGEMKLSEIMYVTYNDDCKEENVLINNYDAFGSLNGYTNQRNYYDDLGRLVETVETSSADGNTWKNSVRHTYSYDDVLKDKLISKEKYDYDESNNEWMYDQNTYRTFYTEVVRDQFGRVSMCSKWRNSSKEKPIGQNVITYIGDEDAKAARIVVCINDYNGGFMPLYSFDDIKWYNTDNQLVNIEMGDMSFGGIDPANCPEYYELNSCDDQGNAIYNSGYFKAEYDEKVRVVKAAVISYSSQEESKVCDFKYDIDDNGSWSNYAQMWYDYNNNSLPEEDEDLFVRSIVHLMDERGNVKEQQIFSRDYSTGELYQDGGYNFDYTYENDMLVEEIYSDYNNYTQEYEIAERWVYSDFSGVSTGIDDAEFKVPAFATIADGMLQFVNAEGESFVVCDVQGRICMKGTVSTDRVSAESLDNGIYFVKVGSNPATKIVKR